MLKLIIGNKNYSSWSLQPWLLVKYFQIPFEEVLIPLSEGSYQSEIDKYSPAGKVPVLVNGAIKVWESLAICEYIAELYPEKNMWPRQIERRAWARAVAQEMHSGFVPLRTHMPMNIRGWYPGKGRTAEVGFDIVRVLQIWEGCRRQCKNDGPFLFGPFTIADAMFAPVVTRFKTYGVKIINASAEYAQTMRELPAFQEWEAASVKERWVVQESEIYKNDVVKLLR